LRRILGKRASVASAIILLLVASSASAGHDLWYDVTHSSYTKDAYATITTSTSYGAYGPEDIDFSTDLPAGYDVAQQTGTSPISPIPADEEVVGGGTITADWLPLCTRGHRNITVKWEATIPSSAPANTVAALSFEDGIFSIDGYVVRQGASDYQVIAALPSTLFCGAVNGSLTLTFLGSTAAGNKFVQNPATAGNYTWNTSYVDTNGASHSDSDTVTITITN